MIDLIDEQPLSRHSTASPKPSGKSISQPRRDLPRTYDELDRDELDRRAALDPQARRGSLGAG